MPYIPKSLRKSEEELDPPGFLEKTLDVISRPGRATAGAVRAFTQKDDPEGSVLGNITKNLTGERKDDFDKVLQDRGVEEGIGRTVGGMALDLVADPLNVLPIGAIGKVAKATGLSKLAKNVSKATGVQRLVRETVSPTFQMDEPVARLSRMVASAHRSAPERVVAELALKDPRVKNFPSMKQPDKVALEQEMKKLIGSRRDLERSSLLSEFFEAPENRKVFESAKTDSNTLVGDLPGLSPDAIKRLGPKVAQYVPTDFIDALDVKKLDPNPRGIAGKRFDQGMDIWRSMATKYNPRFHVTNAIGNVYNMLSGGVNPIKAYKEGKQANIDKITDIGGVSGQRIRDAMKMFDIDKGLGQHLTYSPNDIEETIKSTEAFLSGKNSGNIVTRTANKVGDAIERTARRGTVIEDMLKTVKKGKLQKRTQEFVAQGLNPSQALEAAQKEMLENALMKSKDVMFDYRELTRPQQAIRRGVAPFATWAFKNTGLQARTLANNPKVPAGVAKIFNTINRETQEQGGVSPDLIPDWLKDNASPQIPPEWTGRDNPVFLKNVLPITDLNNLGVLTDKDARRNLLNYLGPGPTTALELLQNKYKGTGRDIMDERGALTPSIANPALQAIPPSIGEKFMTLRENRSDPNIKQYEIPVGLNYPLNLIPLTTSLGKSAQSFTNPENAKDPLAWLSWLGVPVTEQNKKMLLSTLKARELAKKKQRGIERNEVKREVK